MGYFFAFGKLHCTLDKGVKLIFKLITKKNEQDKKRQRDRRTSFIDNVTRARDPISACFGHFGFIVLACSYGCYDDIYRTNIFEVSEKIENKRVR